MIHFVGGTGDAVELRRMSSNGSVLAISVGYAVYIFSIQSFKHIRTFLTEPGARWSSPFALGTRLLAVPSHGRRFADLQHTRTEDNEELDSSADNALLGSMSTASWTKVDVAKGVENGIKLSARGASYVVSGMQSMLDRVGGEEEGERKGKGKGQGKELGSEGEDEEHEEGSEDEGSEDEGSELDDEEEDEEDEEDDGIRVKRSDVKK